MLAFKNTFIKLIHATIYVGDEEIIETTLLKNSRIDVEKCEEIVAAYDQLLENKKYLHLFLVEDFVTIDKGARSFSASERGLQYSKAEAYVFTSLAHKIIANFYLKFNKPAVPTRFFSTKNEALIWLKCLSI